MKSKKENEKQQKQKNELLCILIKTPIVRYACQKVGVGHTTFYRWKQEDPEFLKKSREVLRYGVQNINDLAESKLLSMITEKNITAIIFWLRHHKQAYARDWDIKGHFKIEDDLDNYERFGRHIDPNRQL